MNADLQSISETLDRLPAADKLEVIEFLARRLRGAQTEPSQSASRMAIDELLHEMSALPVENPSDHLSNRDHDRILYRR